MWQILYSEEFKGIHDGAVYDIIDNDKFQQYKKLGSKNIPTMCVLTIKNKDGYPNRAKCQIVVLDNQDLTYVLPQIQKICSCHHPEPSKTTCCPCYL